MYLELYKTGTYNLKIAQVFGLDVAVFWAALVLEAEKAKENKAISKDGYFVINRDSLKTATTLNKTEQIVCEEILKKADILAYKGSLEKHEEVAIDLQKMLGYIIEDDPETLKQLIKEVVENTKESRQMGAMLGFKAYVVTLVKDPKLALLLQDWVESIYTSCEYKGRFLNRPQVNIFVKSIQDFSKDIEVQKAIVKIGIINAYKDAWWCIERYQKQQTQRLTNLTMTGTAVHSDGSTEPNSMYVFK